MELQRRRAPGRAIAWLAVSIGALSTPQAWAAPPAVTLDGELPFTRAELEGALQIRIAPEHSPEQSAALEARASGVDAIEVVWGSKRRVVSLLGARGPAAARKVAIAIADLLEASLNLSPAALEPASAPKVEPVRPVQPIIAVEPPAPRIPDPARPYALAALVLAGGGNTLDRPAIGVSIDGALRVRSSISALMSAGAIWRPAGTAGNAEISTIAFPLRAGLAHRFSFAPLEARATALLTVLAISGDDGTTTTSRTELIPGAGVALSYYLALAQGLDLIAAFGADYHAKELQLLARGRTAMTTDSFAFWAGTGLSFGGAP